MNDHEGEVELKSVVLSLWNQIFLELGEIIDRADIVPIC